MGIIVAIKQDYVISKSIYFSFDNVPGASFIYWVVVPIGQDTAAASPQSQELGT